MRLRRIRTALVMGALLTALLCLTLGASFAFANPGGDNVSDAFASTVPTVAVGSLDASSTDVRDVYAVPLVAGKTYEVTLTADAGTDFDLWLYPPYTKNLIGSNDWWWKSAGPTSSERFVFMAGNSGTFYLEVHAFSGAGAYTLNVHEVPKVAFTLSGVTAPKSAKKGKSVTVSVSLTPRYNSYPYTPIRFYFYRWEHGKYKQKAFKWAYNFKDVPGKTVVSSSYKFPKKGSWAVRARFQDAAHGVSKWTTGYRKIKIK